MKKALLIFSLLILAVTSACSAQREKADAQTAQTAQPSASEPAAPVTAENTADAAAEGKISAEEAHARMSEPSVILDVRTAEEYKERHIPGAVLLPNEEIADIPPDILPVLDTQILIYCRSGNRSAQAKEKLEAMGYTRVFDFGGINDWPYETENGEYGRLTKNGTFSSFSAADLNGVIRDESIFSGHKLTMINIWATFCGPCLDEMPDLGRLAASYADQGLQIVGIAADVYMDENGVFDSEMVQTARDIVAQTGAEYVHLLPSRDLYAAKLDSVFSVPETIFVDANGNQVGEPYIGSLSGEAWTQIIDGLLAEVKG